MVRIYPVQYYRWWGKKEHCPIFAKVVSRVYPNYQGRKGTPNNEYN